MLEPACSCCPAWRRRRRHQRDPLPAHFEHGSHRIHRAVQHGRGGDRPFRVVLFKRTRLPVCRQLPSRGSQLPGGGPRSSRAGHQAGPCGCSRPVYRQLVQRCRADHPAQRGEPANASRDDRKRLPPPDGPPSPGHEEDPWIASPALAGGPLDFPRPNGGRDLKGRPVAPGEDSSGQEPLHCPAGEGTAHRESHELVLRQRVPSRAAPAREAPRPPRAPWRTDRRQHQEPDETPGRVSR